MVENRDFSGEITLFRGFMLKIEVSVEKWRFRGVMVEN